MGNGAKKIKSQDRAERKLKRARAKFEAAREQYTLVREQGRQQVERTQLQADRKLTKINEQLEKRAHALSRAEQRILELEPGQIPTATSADLAVSNGVLPTPEAAADAVQAIQERQSPASRSPFLQED